MTSIFSNGISSSPLPRAVVVRRHPFGIRLPELIVASKRGVVVARAVTQCGCSSLVLSTRASQWAK
jgi:hypothetical protein